MAESDEDSVRGDRRNTDRKQTRIRGWADPGGVAAPADCLILDLSPTGARVASVGNKPLPDTFTLLSDARSPLGEARVVWRGENMVGVNFEKQIASRGDVENVRRELNAPPLSGPRLRKPNE